MSTVHVTRRALTDEESGALLAKHHVGSMALAFHDRVSLDLVNYVYADRWLYGRMEEGPDLTTLRHNHWVAFQVSEIRGLYDWRAVTVNGPWQLLSDRGAPVDAEAARAALASIRAVVPAVFTSRDPVPERVHLFRLYVEEMRGFEMSSVTA